jgi:hypothetical protein
LHELGHALGLDHTQDYRDIMYYFGYGGDIPAYFDRYRSQLHSRADIAKVSGLSDGDVSRDSEMYGADETGAITRDADREILFLTRAPSRASTRAALRGGR